MRPTWPRPRFSARRFLSWPGPKPCSAATAGRPGGSSGERAWRPRASCWPICPGCRPTPSRSGPSTPTAPPAPGSTRPVRPPCSRPLPPCTTRVAFPGPRSWPAWPDSAWSATWPWADWPPWPPSASGPSRPWSWPPCCRPTSTSPSVIWSTSFSCTPSWPAAASRPCAPCSPTAPHGPPEPSWPWPWPQSAPRRPSRACRSTSNATARA